MTTRHFACLLDTPIDGTREATVTIEPVEGRAGQFIVQVRPKGRRTTYRMGLGTVATLVAYRVAKLSATT